VQDEDGGFGLLAEMQTLASILNELSMGNSRLHVLYM
jgi:hypothetical protein